MVAVLFPMLVRAVKVEGCDPIISGYEDGDGEDDCPSPKDRRGEQKAKAAGLRSVQPGLKDQDKEARGVPEGHDATEAMCNAFGGCEMWVELEAVQDGVHEGGDGELISDHESDKEDRAEIDACSHTISIQGEMMPSQKEPGEGGGMSSRPGAGMRQTDLEAGQVIRLCCRGGL